VGPPKKDLMRAGATLALAIALLASGCAGSDADKAGGGANATATALAKPVGRPVTLTLLTVDDLWASEYARLVARLSGGTIRIDVRLGGTAIVDYERRLVEQARAGRGDMVSVGARAWDRMGVTSLRALVAPFLVESLDHEARVLRSPLARRALEGVEPLGLVGLAVLPGWLRHPFGVTRPLLGPTDFAGATIGLRYGRVALDSLTALGATPKGYAIHALGRVDGAELDPWTIARNHYDTTGSALTANVALWARPETIAIRRAAFERLSSGQRDVLRRAGREAIAPTLTRLRRELKGALEVVCGRGAMTLVTASPTQVAALRNAVRPVYATLQRDPQTRNLIAEIRRLGGGADDVPSCAGRGASARVLEGRWRSNATPAAMRAAGATPAEVATFGGAATLELRDGRWRFRNDRTTVTGSYRVSGDGVRLTMRTCTANPCFPGDSTDYAWSVYRDTLTFTRRAGMVAWPRIVATPARRVG